MEIVITVAVLGVVGFGIYRLFFTSRNRSSSPGLSSQSPSSFTIDQTVAETEHTISEVPRPKPEVSRPTPEVTTPPSQSFTLHVVPTEELDTMTKDQLLTVARENSLRVNSRMNKAELREVIQSSVENHR